MASQYAPRPQGLAGNDDLGQMSAWYVFTALGFYPVTPASNEYILGRPFVSRATLQLPQGKSFTVLARGLEAAHPYVASVTLNGKPLTRVFLRHQEILAGGELVFTMSALTSSSARLNSPSAWDRSFAPSAIASVRRRLLR